MKKVVSLLLVGIMAVGMLSGCGSSGDKPTVSDVEQPTGSAAPEWDEYNSLVKQIRSAVDPTEREKLMHEAEDMLMETGAVLPLYYYNDVYMLKDGIKGLYANVFGYKYFMYVTGAKDGVFSGCMASEPNYLDPALNSTVDGACYAVNAFAGLYTYDENKKCVPELAQKTDVSDDGLTYTFTLKDSKWSDGSDCTAADFEYAWKRAANPETGADYSYLFDCFAKDKDGNIDVKASEDGKTLTAVLTAPCSYFTDLCASPTFMPVKQSEVEAQKDYKTNPSSWTQDGEFISNGAYKIKSWTHDESIIFEKNDNYINADKVETKELHFMLSADDTAIFAAYNSGDLDFTDIIPTDEMESVKSKSDFYKIDQVGTYFVSFNVNSELFAGKTAEEANTMRKALALLVDRDYVVANVAQAEQEIANTFIPTGMSDGNGGEFRTNDDVYTYPNETDKGYYAPAYSEENRDEAIEMLKSVGYEFDDSGMLSANTPISIEYLVNEGSLNVGTAEALQQDFAGIGIDMTITTEEWQVFAEDRKAGNFDVCRDGWVADYNDPINMLEMWTTESGNNNCQFGR